MSGKDELERRLEEMESGLAHQEKTIQDLSDVITAQGNRIDRLLTAVEHLKERLLVLEETSKGGGPVDEKPPHY